MKHYYVTHDVLTDFIQRLDSGFARPGRLYLIGETSQVFENWRRWTPQIEFSAEVAPSDQEAFTEWVHELRTRTGLAVYDESPGDLIPLPDGYRTRARPAGGNASDNGRDREGPTHLELYHFDPYSVAFRFVARGDESDYDMVLKFLEHGWLTLDEMDARLAELLPRFSADTIQQDPSEFRRKYTGLAQMWRAVEARRNERARAAL